MSNGAGGVGGVGALPSASTVTVAGGELAPALTVADTSGPADPCRVTVSGPPSEVAVAQLIGMVTEFMPVQPEALAAVNVRTTGAGPAPAV
jgi:hypothetical protein